MKYAIDKNNETINIKDASNGKSCECICKCCSEPVMAKQGKVKDWHFAHISKIDCKYSNNPGETDLHILAKEVFKKNKSLYVQSVWYDHHGDDVEILKGCDVKFDKVELEKRVDRFTPDIIAHKGSEQIWIEIAVTHFTEKNKIDYCRENNITLIEIDLNQKRKAHQHLQKALSKISDTEYNTRDIDENDILGIFEKGKYQELLWSTKLFNKVNKYYAVDFNYYYDLVSYQTGLNKSFLNYPLTGKTTQKAVEERLKVLQCRAKAQSKKRLISSVNYIKNQIHDIKHLNRWWINEQYHRKMKNGTPIFPDKELILYVEAKAYLTNYYDADDFFNSEYDYDEIKEYIKELEESAKQ